MSRRVVITGMGVTTPLGTGLRTFWEAALAGRSGVRRITYYDPTPYPTQIAGEVPDFDVSAHPSLNKPRRYSRAARFGLLCSLQALEDAGLAPKTEDVSSAGVFVGTGQGGGPESEEAYRAFYVDGWRRIPPLTVPKAMPNSIANHIAIEYGLHGPNVTITNACSSSAEAAGRALDEIRSGRVDLVLAGGAESMLFEAMMSAWCRLRVMSTRNDRPEKASRPFDKGRDGMVMAEGAGMLVLEDRERALARGARVYAEIIGWASGCDAFHITAPSVEGQARTIRDALADAGVSPEEVGYISAHGTSTPLNDVAETKAIKEVFGKSAHRIPISSLKSMTGHPLGAAGVMELAVTTLSLHHGWLHPTINLDDPVPECDLDYIPHQAREADVEVAVSNHFAFGGSNAVLVLRRHRA